MTQFTWAFEWPVEWEALWWNTAQEQHLLIRPLCVQVCARCSVLLINRGAIKGTGCPNWPVFLMYSIIYTLFWIISSHCAQWDKEGLFWLTGDVSTPYSILVVSVQSLLNRDLKYWVMIYEWLPMTCCVTPEDDSRGMYKYATWFHVESVYSVKRYQCQYQLEC